MTDRTERRSRAHTVFTDGMRVIAVLLATWLAWRMLSRFPFTGSPAAEIALYVLMVVSGILVCPIALTVYGRLPQGVLEGKSTLQLLLEPRPHDTETENAWWWARLGGSAGIVSILAGIFLMMR
jgi:hypothetical protein